MRNLILSFFLFANTLPANAWDLSDKAKREEFQEFAQRRVHITQKLIKEDSKKSNEIMNKYFNNDIEISQNDAADLANLIRLTGDIIYADIVSKSLQSVDSSKSKFRGVDPDALQLLNVFYHLLNSLTDRAKLLQADFYELAEKIESREITKGVKTKLIQLNADFSVYVKDNERKINQALEDIKNNRTPRNENNKLEQSRILAANDVVAQVLNYAAGVPEDASGNTFFYPANTENGQCIYKLAIDANNPMGAMSRDIANGLVEASKFASAMTGQKDPSTVLTDGFDLRKGDLKNINFYKLQGAQRNKFTGTTAYLRYQSRVEGLPDLFECDSNSCNIERLKRGWALVASKCKGTKKAF